jgi:hypothetical protein
VEYLLDNYGQDKMLDLLALLKQGSTYDEALMEAYGFDIEGLDASWRAMLATPSVIASDLPACSSYDFGRRAKAWQAGARQSHPALIPVLAALATALALVGALALEKRTWRKSSGKSTT